jgi:intracellular sulfur oxidation DsrE/DsrF family protein
MIKQIIFIVCLIVCSFLAKGQKADYKVIFDMSSNDTVNQRAVIRELQAISKERPDAQLEVTVYGEALPLVLKDKSDYADAIQQLISNKKANFKVCSMTMKRMNADKSQLIAGVDVVPDGIYEIISKQREGWGYIKVAH